jgi:hypothetical protein
MEPIKYIITNHGFEILYVIAGIVFLYYVIFKKVNIFQGGKPKK